MLVYLIAVLLLIEVKGIPIQLVYSACRQNPSLHLCDSHILGPLPSTTPVPVIEKSIEFAGFGSEKENGDFVKWLTEYKDEPTEVPENASRIYDNTEVYCAKYKRNYNRYCSNRANHIVNGVRNRFCTLYESRCERKPTFELLEDELVDFPEELEELDLTLSTEKVTTAGEQQKSQEIVEYCRQYTENFNFFCVGESSAETEPFCRSYRRRCL